MISKLLMHFILPLWKARENAFNKLTLALLLNNKYVSEWMNQPSRYL